MAEALQDWQHLVSPIYPKILFKRAMSQSKNCSSVLWNSFWRGQICTSGCSESWGTFGLPEAPSSPRLFWPRFTGTSHEGEALAVSRGSQKCQLHTQQLQPWTKKRVAFYRGGWKTCRESNLCYKLLKTWTAWWQQCGSVHGLKRDLRSLSATLHAVSF